MGDFNYKEINWQAQSTTTSEAHPATLFLEATKECFLYQHVEDHTRYREGQQPSTLDLVFTNEENMIESISVEPIIDRSDHASLAFDFVCYPDKILENDKSTKPRQTIKQ